MSTRALVDVFIIDDDANFREMISTFLQTKNITCRDFPCPIQALENYAPAQVGCVLVDIKMSRMNGIQVTKQLKSIDPLVPIIAVTGYGNITDAVATIKSGAIEYIEKPFNLNVLYEKIMSCLSVTQAVRKQRMQDSKMRINFDTLTFRERQILTLLSVGLSNKEIGLSLDISYRTVEVHRAKIMEKLGANSIADLVRITHYMGHHFKGA